MISIQKLEEIKLKKLLRNLEQIIPYFSTNNFAMLHMKAEEVILRSIKSICYSNCLLVVTLEQPSIFTPMPIHLIMIKNSTLKNFRFIRFQLIVEIEHNRILKLAYIETLLLPG